MSLFRFIAVLGRTQVMANTLGSATLIAVYILGGFVISKGQLFILCKFGEANYNTSPSMWFDDLHTIFIPTNFVSSIRQYPTMAALGVLGLSLDLWTECSSTQ